jgi:carbamoyltransferase
VNVLGISCYFHDAAAALVRDGELVAAAEEERFTRRKHDARFPEHAIAFCLRAAGLDARDLDCAVFYEKPFQKFERLLVSSLEAYPRSGRLFREATISWLGDKLWVKDHIRKRLGIPASRILFAEHHLSHAASAFFCSPFEEAAILTVDGVGEWSTTLIAEGRGPRIRPLKEIRFPHSIGLLYSAFTAWLGFEVNEGEYKVMGLAAYGKPKYADRVRRLLRVSRDGSFELDLDYFDYHRTPARMFNGRFEALFGPAGRQDPDVAASVQLVTEEAVLALAREAYAATGLGTLCLAGGVALNSVANARIMRETPFCDVWVQPAAGDSGGALGAALLASHAELGAPRRFTMCHAYWGERHGSGEVEGLLASRGIAYRRLAEDELTDRAAALLAKGAVLGWVQDRFEWGPRALGNRSILADPRRGEMKDVLNRKIKRREPFRPFAPSVAAARAAKYFDIPAAGRHAAQFMLCVAPVREEVRAAIPAVTHVDGTARVQAVAEAANPRYYRLIEAFGDRTGVPVVLNTSFNLQGEPIVNTPAEALSAWERSGMDALVLGDCLVERGR